MQDANARPVILVDVSDMQVSAHTSATDATRSIEWRYDGDHRYYAIELDGLPRRLESPARDFVVQFSSVPIDEHDEALVATSLNTYREVTGLATCADPMSPPALQEIWDRLSQHPRWGFPKPRRPRMWRRATP